MRELLHALNDVGVTDKRDIYLACIIESNWEIFRKVMKMIPELKERFLEAGEEDGWFSERDMKRDMKRDIENARTLKSNNVPVTVILQTTKTLSFEEVEAL